MTDGCPKEEHRTSAPDSRSLVVAGLRWVGG